MTALTKEEYLKRYLSPQESGVKVKKKRKSKKLDVATKKVSGFKIVDDDVSLDNIMPKPDEFDEVNDKLLTNDERPLIENLDVRTEEEKKLDEYRRSKMWRSLGADSPDAGGDAIDRISAEETNRSTGKRRKKKSKRHDSDSDLDDLPRATRRKRHDSDSDLDDIPRNGRRRSDDSDSDIDVPRATMRHDSDSDMELPRAKGSKSRGKANRHDSDSDLEVKRNKPEEKKQMQSGGRGGLTSVDLLRLEMDKLKKKDSAIKKMAEEYKNTETVFRERGSGKKRDIAKEKKENDEEVARKKRKEEQYNKWGRGLKQAELRADAVADTIHESNKTLARYNDDEDLEAMRKAAIREGDPMAEYMAKKKRKEKGETEELPKYKGPAPAPNRFNIMPGYRWDGVDRSNGFEKKYYQTQSDNQALKDEYYKWSVGDM